MSAGTAVRTGLATAGRSGAPRSGARLPRAEVRLAAWYATVACYAGAVVVFSGPGRDRIWGTWAVVAYAVSASVVLLWRSRGRDLALAISLAGALTGPLAWLAIRLQAAPEVQVLGRSALLLLRQGSPYYTAEQLAQHASSLAYNPYLPDMTVFGLPAALGLRGLAGNTTVWLAVTTAALLFLAFRLAGRPDPVRSGLLALTSPMIALPLAVGATDPPVLALLCLTLALLTRDRLARDWLARDWLARGWLASQWSRLVLAAIALGAACAMKSTAWPALPVLAAMLGYRDGLRAAARFTAATTITAASLFAAFAPGLLARPAALIQNTMLFPLGLARTMTPAASPLPGHLIAATGSAGRAVALALLVAAGVTVAVSLLLRPPADLPAATWRLAIGLTLMFALMPAGRFGYFDYPLGLCGWVVLSFGIPRLRPTRVASALLAPAPARLAPATTAILEGGPGPSRLDNDAGPRTAIDVHRPRARAGRACARPLCPLARRWLRSYPDAAGRPLAARPRRQAAGAPVPGARHHGEYLARWR